MVLKATWVSSISRIQILMCFTNGQSLLQPGAPQNFISYLGRFITDFASVILAAFSLQRSCFHLFCSLSSFTIFFLKAPSAFNFSYSLLDIDSYLSAFYYFYSTFGTTPYFSFCFLMSLIAFKKPLFIKYNAGVELTEEFIGKSLMISIEYLLVQILPLCDILLLTLLENITSLHFLLKLKMIFDQSQQSMNAWKSQMHLYEKAKRTKKPFGKTASSIEHVTHQQIKTKECMFNPILQAYQKEADEQRCQEATHQKRARSLMNHLKQTFKYEKNFDIVNLKSNESYEEKVPIRKLGPIRNAYNVINNQKIPDYFFHNREVKLPIERQKKLLENYKKEYDIVSNVYKENHEAKVKNEVEKETSQLVEKYWKTHTYDPVYGRLYDQKREEQFQKERQAQELEHGKDANKTLPPSYQYREPFIIDYSKPLPETLKILDERNANAKKRFQAKYVVMDEYQKRNEEQQIKQKHILKNHVHFGRILDQKAKEFDIVTNKPYKETRAEELYGKKLQVKSWDVLIREAAKGGNVGIKSGGFN